MRSLNSASNFDYHPLPADTGPEVSRPVKQLTLLVLLGVIADKTKDGIAQRGQHLARLHAPGDNACVATVWQITRGTFAEHPDRTGQINLLKNDGEYGGQKSTNYYILESDDGLAIEKFTKTYPARKDFRDVRVSPQDEANFATEGLRILATSHQPEKVADDGVSEQETQDLLTLLDPLVPFEIAQRYSLNAGQKAR